VVFGCILVAIIFNARINNDVYKVNDTAVGATLINGGAYSHASKDVIGALSQPIQAEVIELYTTSLRAVWYAAAALAAVGVVLAATEKLIILRVQTPAERKKAKEEQAEEEKLYV
jgi:hypothetical protein